MQLQTGPIWLNSQAQGHAGQGKPSQGRMLRASVAATTNVLGEVEQPCIERGSELVRFLFKTVIWYTRRRLTHTHYKTQLLFAYYKKRNEVRGKYTVGRW